MSLNNIFQNKEEEHLFINKLNVRTNLSGLIECRKSGCSTMITVRMTIICDLLGIFLYSFYMYQDNINHKSVEVLK